MLNLHFEVALFTVDDARHFIADIDHLFPDRDLLTPFLADFYERCQKLVSHTAEFREQFKPTP